MDSDGNYTVIQQGMNDRWARRYHWTFDQNSAGMRGNSFSEKPRDLIACNQIIDHTLDLTAEISGPTRQCILDLINDNPAHLRKYFPQNKNKTILSLDHFLEAPQEIKNENRSISLSMPIRHYILPIDLGDSEFQILLSAYEKQPSRFDELVGIQGLGPKKLRALSLVSELIYGTQVSWKDPVKYSFAHGGKDGIPFPVDRCVYDSTIHTLRSAIDNAQLSHKNQLKALKNLSFFSTKHQLGN